jgi:DNA/RNA-binding domain of Phe-tRNA-synthetase-like protein
MRGYIWDHELQRGQGFRAAHRKVNLMASTFAVSVTGAWKNAFPEAHIGLLLVGKVDNSRRLTPLDAHKMAIASSLQARYAGYGREQLQALEILKAYKNYYKRFDKTYHVQLQLESIALKGKPLPNVNPLVDANFVAEMESLLLSAGHDADLLVPPIVIDASRGSEQFVQMNGEPKTLKAQDMMMVDAQGVVCTVIYGQDARTPISPQTSRALYVTYAPPGITAETVHHHLEIIKANILLFAPGAEIEHQVVHSATRP